MAVNTLDRIRMMRFQAFQWRCELSTVKKVALAVAFAGVTGLAAQLRVPLPWTPVPITGQTFAALLAGVMLGRWWGGISMVFYAGLGVAGLPWFAGWKGGMAALAGPTGGYIIGFILAAFFVGHFTDKYLKTRKFPALLGLMLVANILLIYIPGLIQLYLWLTLVSGKSVTILQVLNMGAFPFIAGDAVKALAATGIAWAALPKQSFHKEVNRDKA